MMNLPNALTLSRLIFIPILVFVFYLPIPYRFELLAVIFLAASATDFIDGYVARRQAQITKLGKLLDPVVDKILISAALLLLVEAGKLWAWVAILIIGREIAVTGLRAVASSSGIVIQAEGMGKLKMIFQVAGISLLFLVDASTHYAIWVAGVVVLGISVLLALLSGGQYALKVGHLFYLAKNEQ